MSKDTEKIFRDLQKFLSEKNVENDQELKGMVSDFMAQYNKKTAKKKGKEASDYLDMAYEADSEAEALKYAKKALQLDKNCLDAEMMIAELTAEDGDSLKLTYEKLIAKEEKKLAEAGIDPEHEKGNYWLILETRPYIRARYSYLRLLMDLGKLKLAVHECETLLELSEGDAMGVRYHLMALYALFEDEMNAIRLHKKYNEEDSANMLLPIIALYYKQDRYKQAEAYLEKLKKVNGELEEIFSDPNEIDGILDDMDDVMDEIIASGMYQAGGREEIMAAMAEASFLYTTSSGFYLWMTARV